jgi:hypothetical protein
VGDALIHVQALKSFEVSSSCVLSDEISHGDLQCFELELYHIKSLLQVSIYGS